MSGTEAVPEESMASELTAFQHRILTVLSAEPMYGLAVKRQLEDYYDSDINHGRLYPNLDDLVELGLVEKSELDKRTNQYALTESGRDVIVERLDWTLSKFASDEDRIEIAHELVDENR